MAAIESTELSAELVDVVHRLSPQAKDQLFDLLLEDCDNGLIAVLPQGWNEEITTRLLAYQRGELETLSVEDSVRELDQVLAVVTASGR